MTFGPCLCGDPHCGSCGPAQGFHRCEICGRWNDDENDDGTTGCINPEDCAKQAKLMQEKSDRDELTLLFYEHREDGHSLPGWAREKARFIYSKSEVGFWNNKDGWGSFDTATVFMEGDETVINLPYTGEGMDCRWVGYEESLTLPDDPEKT